MVLSIDGLHPTARSALLLKKAIDSGLVPQTIRDPKLGNIKNAR
jgi:hypothetical protein